MSAPAPVGQMAKKQNTNRIGELRLNRSWSQGELADRCGAHWVTISKLERGQMQLTQDWMERLAAVFGVHPTEILADPPLFRTVYVRGGILDASNVLSYNIFVDKKEESVEHEGADDMTFSVQFGAPESDRTVWYIVESEAFYPFIRAGDFVRFTYPAFYDAEMFVGRICLIDVDVEDRGRLIGVPTRGSSNDLFNIQIFGKDLISNARVKEIAYMSMLISNPDIDTYEDGEPKP